MNAGECCRRSLRLVRLQVADEMPPYLHVGRVSDLLQPLLDFVLAKVDLACAMRGSHVIGAERL
jgi:hypothetical protein